MTAHINTLRELVIDEVTTRIAAEQAAGRPLDLLNRRFDAIVADLMMLDWERHAHKPVAQIVVDLCFPRRRGYSKVRR